MCFPISGNLSATVYSRSKTGKTASSWRSGESIGLLNNNVAGSKLERGTNFWGTGTQIKESFELRVKARSIAADVLTDVATRLFVDNLLASMDKVQEIALFIGSMLVANKAIRHARARKRLDRDFEEWKKLKGGGKDLSGKYHDWRQAVDMATDSLANAEAKFMRDRLLAPLNEIDLQYQIAAAQVARKATGIARARLITEQRVRALDLKLTNAK
ncbi:unnamed protein product [Dibothriocephalus latus]|uniref:Uncharacterized protein n=1 Tax=Dibothriocephalus latus TaxID=60516 RepID=A0A3P7LQ77_DIBLA|nr:unnamed protein product [Dibothriocephalus latus]